MDNDLEEHLAKDKDNKFHGCSVAQRLRELPDMTLSIYLEVQMIWEQLQRSREFHDATTTRYLDLCSELKALVEEYP